VNGKMSDDRSSFRSIGGELEKKVMESPQDFPCEILDFIEEARKEIFAVINDDSLGGKEAWTNLVTVIEKWFGNPKERGTLESIKLMLQEKMKRKQKVDGALQYKNVAAEAKRTKLE
jgi:hypothetical protein